MKSRLPPSDHLNRQLLGAAKHLAERGKLDGHEADVVSQASSAGAEPDSPEKGSIIGILQSHSDELSGTQRQALEQVLGKAPTPRTDNVVDLGVVRDERQQQLAGVQQAASRQLDVPGDALTERSVLEDLLQRHGTALDSQLRNLVVGFLRTLPEDEAGPAPVGQLGLLAQVIAMRSPPPATQRRLDIDAEQTPVPRADVEKLLAAHQARGQLLVALGVASKDELQRFDQGEMSLGEFYRLAARGHFGEDADRPIAYEALDERMSSAGLEGEVDTLIEGLSDTQRKALLDGAWTPRQIFTALAVLHTEQGRS